MNPENRLALLKSNNNGEELFPAPPQPFFGERGGFGGGSSSSGGGMKLNDVLFILFRHKWKVLVCTLLGIAGAVAAYFLLPPKYESQAKLFVRYVVDRSAVDRLDAKNQDVVSPTAAAINAEVEILTSTDLAAQVVQKFGAAKILGDHRQHPNLSETELAAREIFKNLEVKVVANSNIISVIYRNKDPLLARAVLEELLKDYAEKHLEVHRSLGTYDFVSKEAAQLEKSLTKTTGELKALKAKVGITSLGEDTAALAQQISKTQAELDTAEGELAAQQAKVDQLQALGVAASEEDAAKKSHPATPPSAEIIGRYKAVIASLAKLHEDETALLSRFTVQNPTVKTKQNQIDDLEKYQRTLETRYPALLAVEVDAKGVPGQPGRLDPIAEKARLTELETRVATLKPRLEALQARSALLADIGPQISILQQKFNADQENYKYYGSSLEKAQLDERLDPSRIPNISIVAAPSPPDRAKGDLRKIAPALIAGGLLIGLMWAFLIEKVLDRTIKRTGEMEERLRIPVLMAIPRLPELARPRLRYSNGDAEAEAEEEEAAGALLRPFCETIRDELGLFFQMNQMRHKPKLVAVTGLTRAAGASSLAAGLAEAIGEVVGTDKVCFVDKVMAAGRFYASLEEFRASELEYVVFDLPPVGEASSTAPLSGFMDKLLLVVEAEKSTPPALNRIYAKLASKVDTSVIFNKRRSYGPRWLEVEV
jgi:uncharacterized protein involved in exopolysaccharide biosynthesis